MIICLCKNVSDREIKALAGEGKRLCEVVKSSEAGTCCGACTEDIRKIIDRESKPARSKTPVRES